MSLSVQPVSGGDSEAEMLSGSAGRGRDGGLGWWWHTIEDTVEKIDPDLLAAFYRPGQQRLPRAGFRQGPHVGMPFARMESLPDAKSVVLGHGNIPRLSDKWVAASACLLNSESVAYPSGNAHLHALLDWMMALDKSQPAR